MKADTDKHAWGAQVNDWITLLLISCGIIFGSSFILGPLLSGSTITQKIVVAYHCPSAIDITEEHGPIVQVGSDPNSFGQSVQVICTFADGSTKAISNDEYAVSTIVGSIALGAIFGVAIAVIFMPIYIFWKKKPR
ncbi:MAG: hypothetical protein AB1607_11315 [Chloroflexota bacterium]